MRRLLLALALLATLVGCTTITATNGFVSSDGSITRVDPGGRKAAPAVSGTTLDGESWTSASAAGKVLVYNVWGSWCAPCRKEAPALAEAARRTAGQAVFVGINVRDLDKAPSQAFARAFDVPYPSLYDPDGSLLLPFAGDLPANAIPTTLVIDTQGRVAARILGETTTATLTALIDDVAAGK